MATTNPFHLEVHNGCKATVNLAAATDIGIAVGYDGAIATAGTTAVYGISLQATTEAGRGTIVTSDEAIAQCGAALASVGTALAAGTGGKLVAATAGDNIIGRSLTVTGADGEYLRILITREGVA